MQFFKDSTDTTRIHWYPVPHDRPFLPVPSFVANAYWTNDQGPRPPNFVGNPPGEQGERWADRPFDKRQPPQPWEQFTGHYCGTPEQWAGELYAVDPRSIGHAGCCSGADWFMYGCGCGALASGVQIGQLAHVSGCGCGALASGVTFQGFPTCEGCGCGSLTSTVAFGFYVPFSGCGCGSLASGVSFVTMPTCEGCGCGSMASVVSFGGLVDVSGCGCGAIASAVSGIVDVSGCGCGKMQSMPLFQGFPTCFGCGCGNMTSEVQFLPYVSYTCADVTATGSDQTSATEIGDDNVNVTSTADLQGVRLPSACGRFLVRNANSGITMYNVKVYPPTGGTISGGSTNAPVTLFPGSNPVLFVTWNHLDWRQVSTS